MRNAKQINHALAEIMYSWQY